jgi:hypothetical protein
MNLTLIFALIRQRLFSPLRMVLVFTFFSFPLLVALGMPGAGSQLSDFLFVLVLGAGMVGQDVSSGVLPGLLARPVRRSEYAVSRWLAVAAAAAALVLLQAAMVFGIQVLRGATPALAAAATGAVEAVFKVFGLSAVLLLLSCCVNGLGDLGLYLLGTLAGQLLQGVGQLKSWVWMERAGSELSGLLGPKLELAQLAGAGFSAFAVVSYLSTLTLCLALAIVIMNRKELSYAAG